jgi:hypothetical protein
MKPRWSLAVVVLLLLVGSARGAADSEAFDVLVGDINRELSRTTSELGRLSETLRAPPPGADPDETIPRGVSPWVPAADASMAVERVRTQLTGIEDKLRELEALERKIQQDKRVLEQERDRLMEEKADLEDRERLWSMGFYASLSATTAAVIGLIVRLPTSRLQRRLTCLEIEQKELELARARRESV